MKEDNKTKSRIMSNLIWRYAERSGALGVEAIVALVLARILDPELYGTIAIVIIFMTILQVFVDSGMGNALIQNKDTDDLDYSTVFFFNVVLCCVLYTIAFCTAPLVSKFFDRPELTPIVRVLCLTIVFSGVKNVQQAYVSKTMQFKRFFYATLGGTIGAAVIGIVMALRGFGVWALVAQQVFNVAIDTLILWITVRFRPKLMFSFQRLKRLLAYGWKLFVSSLVDTVYTNAFQVLIGKWYTSADLGCFNRGKQFPEIILTCVNSSIESVMFPVASSMQDRTDDLKQLTRRAIKISCFIIWPVLTGLAVCSRPLITVLLTEKWLPCVPFLRIFCFFYAFLPIHTAHLNAIKAVGRSDIFLKLEIRKKIIGILLLVIAFPHGVLAIGITFLLTAPINAVINAAPNVKLINYSYREQIRDIMPALLLSLAMGAFVLAISFIRLHVILILIMQIVAGICIYVGGAILFKVESFGYILNLIRRK